MARESHVWNNAIGNSKVLALLLDFGDLNLLQIANMLNMSATTGATSIISCQLEHSKLLACGNIRGYSTCINQLGLCFLIGAHFLEYIHLCRG